jgi:hypothetical protein
MRVIVPCSKRASKGGAAFSADGIPLTGFGLTEDQAMRELETGVTAWCRALSRQGLLDSALDRAGLQREDDGQEGIQVVIISAPGACHHCGE